MKDKTTIMRELFAALQELTELKNIKETQGETGDYLKRKPLAWSTAKRLVKEHSQDYKYWGVKA
jgi:hypothetical protein